jgi:hypothetical protein
MKITFNTFRVPHSALTKTIIYLSNFNSFAVEQHVQCVSKRTLQLWKRK